MTRGFLAPAALALALVACGKDSPVANEVADVGDQAIVDANAIEPPTDGVDLIDAKGEPIGKVAMADAAGALELTVTANGLSEGEHGLHLHTAGLCGAPDFTTAEGHLNPGGKKHGRDNPAGAHLGDLANLVVGKDGTATVKMSVANFSMKELADADGTALVVHADPDDYKTDPSGESGSRIACSVLAAPKSGGSAPVAKVGEPA